MKKNFFKKLSFVLALAMIISTVAPAAGAFAAAKPKLNSAKEYLFLGSGNDEQYDFNVKNTKKGWTYKWSSADQAIATVDTKGVVTAKSIGTVKVSVIISNKGEEVTELKASVIVKDNIASLKITNTPAGDKLSANKENAFASTYTTKSGSTTKTTSIVKWSVDKTDATISDAGVFVAKKAGAYKVTAMAFQSTATYATWLTSKAANLVLATADYTVTVPAEISTVAATKSTQLKVTFSSAVTAVDKANFVVTNTATTNKLFIKAVTLSDDKTYATVDLYDTLVSGSTYSVAATVDSTAMKGEVKYVKGTPTKIVAATAQTAPINANYYIAYQVLDENGVDITADTTVSFESAYNLVNYSTGAVKYTTAGIVDYVYVVYTNPTTAAQIRSDKIAVTSVDSVATDVSNYTLSTATDGSVSFAAVDLKTSIGLSADNTYYVRFKYKDQYGVEQLAPYTASTLSFETLDSSIFVIDAKSGLVHPVSAGTGYFRITYGNISVVKSLTVRAAEKLTSLAVKWGNVKDVSCTGINGINGNPAYVVVEAFNQYGEEMKYDKNVPSTTIPLTYQVLTGGGLLSNNNGTTALAVNSTGSVNADNGMNMFAYNGITTNGTATVKIYATNDTSVYTTCVFNVYKADNVETGITVGFEYGGSTLDINSKYDNDADTGYNTHLKVYAVNSKNFHVDQITDATITVTGPNGKYITAVSGSAGVTIDPTITVTGQEACDWAYLTGTYTVVAKKNGVQIGSTFTFTVNDTGTLPTVAFKNGNDVTGGSLNIATLTDKLSGIDGYTVKEFQCVAADASLITSTTAGSTGWYTALTYSGNTTLYNFKVKLTKTVYGQTREVIVNLYTGVDLQL